MTFKVNNLGESRAVTRYTADCNIDYFQKWHDEEKESRKAIFTKVIIDHDSTTNEIKVTTKGWRCVEGKKDPKQIKEQKVSTWSLLEAIDLAKKSTKVIEVLSALADARTAEVKRLEKLKA